jgi:uncharacterized membrane protein YccF (DUF307 family)
MAVIGRRADEVIEWLGAIGNIIWLVLAG